MNDEASQAIPKDPNSQNAPSDHKAQGVDEEEKEEEEEEEVTDDRKDARKLTWLLDVILFLLFLTIEIVLVSVYM